MPYLFSGNTAGNSTGSSPTNVPRANGFFSTDPVGGAAQFASSRAWLAGNTASPSRQGTDLVRFPPVVTLDQYGMSSN